MTEKPMKRVQDSLTEQVQIVQQTHMNGYHRLFGGQLIAWMDVVAGVVGRRHTGMTVTTAAIDNLQFLAPAYVDDMIVITGRVTYVGRTSMEAVSYTHLDVYKRQVQSWSSAPFFLAA